VRSDIEQERQKQKSLCFENFQIRFCSQIVRFSSILKQSTSTSTPQSSKCLLTYCIAILVSSKKKPIALPFYVVDLFGEISQF